MQFKKSWLSLSNMIFIMALITTSAWALSPLIIANTSKLASIRNADIYNLKQIGLALLQYAQDYDETIPDSRSSANSLNPTEQQITRFLTAKPEDNLPAGKNPGYAQILRPYIRNLNIIYSSGDIRRDTVSYWWKYALDKAAIKSGTISFGNVPYPGSQVIIYENSPYYTGYTHGLKDGTQIAVCYLDGHVDGITIKNGNSAYPTKSEQISGEAAKRLGSPMFFNNRNGTQHSGAADYENPYTDKDSF